MTMNLRKTTLVVVLGGLCSSATAFAQQDPAEESEPDLSAEAEPGTAGEPGTAAEPGTAGEAQAEPVAAQLEAGMDVQVESLSSTEPTWNIGLAPRIGLAVPTSKLSPFVSLGLEIGYRLPAMEKRLSVLLDVAYTKPSHDETLNDPRVGGDANFEIDESEFKVGLGGSFRLFTDEKALVPWAGVAAVMQRLSSTETNALAPGENTSTDTRFGGELSAGADYRLGPGYALGEARMVLTDLDDLITGNSNAGNVNLSLGYRLVF